MLTITLGSILIFDYELQVASVLPTIQIACPWMSLCGKETYIRLKKSMFSEMFNLYTHINTEIINSVKSRDSSIID